MTKIILVFILGFIFCALKLFDNIESVLIDKIKKNDFFMFNHAEICERYRLYYSSKKTVFIKLTNGIEFNYGQIIFEYEDKDLNIKKAKDDIFKEIESSKNQCFLIYDENELEMSNKFSVLIKSVLKCNKKNIKCFNGISNLSFKFTDLLITLENNVSGENKFGNSFQTDNITDSLKEIKSNTDSLEEIKSSSLFQTDNITDCLEEVKNIIDSLEEMQFRNFIQENNDSLFLIVVLTKSNTNYIFYIDYKSIDKDEEYLHVFNILVKYKENMVRFNESLSDLYNTFFEIDQEKNTNLFPLICSKQDENILIMNEARFGFFCDESKVLFKYVEGKTLFSLSPKVKPTEIKVWVKTGREVFFVVIPETNFGNIKVKYSLNSDKESKEGETKSNEGTEYKEFNFSVIFKPDSDEIGVQCRNEEGRVIFFISPGLKCNHYLTGEDAEIFPDFKKLFDFVFKFNNNLYNEEIFNYLEKRNLLESFLIRIINDRQSAVNIFVINYLITLSVIEQSQGIYLSEKMNTEFNIQNIIQNYVVDKKYIISAIKEKKDSSKLINICIFYELEKYLNMFELEGNPDLDALSLVIYLSLKIQSGFENDKDPIISLEKFCEKILKSNDNLKNKKLLKEEINILQDIFLHFDLEKANDNINSEENKNIIEKKREKIIEKKREKIIENLQEEILKKACTKEDENIGEESDEEENIVEEEENIVEEEKCIVEKSESESEDRKNIVEEEENMFKESEEENIVEEEKSIVEEEEENIVEEEEEDIVEEDENTVEEDEKNIVEEEENIFEESEEEGSFFEELEKRIWNFFN